MSKLHSKGLQQLLYCMKLAAYLGRAAATEKGFVSNSQSMCNTPKFTRSFNTNCNLELTFKARPMSIARKRKKTLAAKNKTWTNLDNFDDPVPENGGRGVKEAAIVDQLNVPAVSLD